MVWNGAFRSESAVLAPVRTELAYFGSFGWYDLIWPESAWIVPIRTLAWVGMNRCISGKKKKKKATRQRCAGSSVVGLLCGGFVAASVLHRYTPMYLAFVLWKLWQIWQWLRISQLPSKSWPIEFVLWKRC